MLTSHIRQIYERSLSSFYMTITPHNSSIYHITVHRHMASMYINNWITCDHVCIIQTIQWHHQCDTHTPVMPTVLECDMTNNDYCDIIDITVTSWGHVTTTMGPMTTSHDDHMVTINILTVIASWKVTRGWSGVVTTQTVEKRSPQEVLPIATRSLSMNVGDGPVLTATRTMHTRIVLKDIAWQDTQHQGTSVVTHPPRQLRSGPALPLHHLIFHQMNQMQGMCPRIWGTPSGTSQLVYTDVP